VKKVIELRAGVVDPVVIFRLVCGVVKRFGAWWTEIEINGTLIVSKESIE
jgi:hypothetical protein